MPVQLNHTIVAAKDPHASATFLAEILRLPAPVRFGHFEVVTLENGVSWRTRSTAALRTCCPWRPRLSSGAH